jgi:hypothetical protein
VISIFGGENALKNWFTRKSPPIKRTMIIELTIINIFFHVTILFILRTTVEAKRWRALLKIYHSGQHNFQ